MVVAVIGAAASFTDVQYINRYLTPLNPRLFDGYLQPWTDEAYF
jgi:hypothetical protein